MPVGEVARHNARQFGRKISPIHVPALMREVVINIRVTGRKRLAMRLWAGTKVLALAAWVMGCNIDVSVADE